MLYRVNKNFETSEHYGFTLVIAYVAVFRTHKRNVGRPKSDDFSGIHLVPVKNAFGL
jgi:hypothetical protein